METAPTNVLVVHEDSLVAAGLLSVLRNCPNLMARKASVMKDMSSGEDCFAEPADVIVADYRSAMAWLSAAYASAQDWHRNARVLIVTPVIREWEVRAALRLGARGYLQQGCPTDEIIQGVQLVAKGSTFLSRTATQCIAEGMTYEPLTARERDVLNLIAEGLCNKSIARQLGISLGTVKTHVKGVLEKLEATTRTHAVVVATRRGLCGQSFDGSDESQIWAPSQAGHRAAFGHTVAA
jgi:DNA-binding NarL/FixJ family response regulator